MRSSCALILPCKNLWARGQGKVSTRLGHQLLNQLHNMQVVATLCPLCTIALLPLGTPSLIEMPQRQKAIEPSGPLCPDVTDVGELLEVVVWHIVCLIPPLMFPQMHLINPVCECLPLSQLPAVINIWGGGWWGCWWGEVGH